MGRSTLDESLTMKPSSFTVLRFLCEGIGRALCPAAKFSIILRIVHKTCLLIYFIILFIHSNIEGPQTLDRIWASSGSGHPAKMPDGLLLGWMGLTIETFSLGVEGVYASFFELKDFGVCKLRFRPSACPKFLPGYSKLLDMIDSLRR